MNLRDAATSQLTQQRTKGIRTAIIVAVAVVVLRYLPLTANLFLFSVVENFAYDVAFGLRGSTPPSNIVVVAIDDESLRPERLGRFPWPRRVYAELLEQLAEAKVVAFDVLFAEPDRYDPQGDAQFAEAIRRHGRVVLGAYKRIQSQYTEGASPKMPSHVPLSWP